MALPNDRLIELPLLLELERRGGRAKKPADFPNFYESVMRHFPGVTTEEKRALRRDEHTPVWTHNIEWARFHLKENEDVNGGVRGIWEITTRGQARLRTELQWLGVPGVELERFIRSSETLTTRLGSKWHTHPRLSGHTS